MKRAVPRVMMAIAAVNDVQASTTELVNTEKKPRRVSVPGLAGAGLAGIAGFGGAAGAVGAAPAAGGEATAGAFAASAIDKNLQGGRYQRPPNPWLRSG